MFCVADEGKIAKVYMYSPLPLAGEVGEAKLRRVRVADPKRDEPSRATLTPALSRQRERGNSRSSRLNA